MLLFWWCIEVDEYINVDRMFLDEKPFENTNLKLIMEFGIYNYLIHLIPIIEQILEFSMRVIIL